MMVVNKNDPISWVSLGFRMKMLHEALFTLIDPLDELTQPPTQEALEYLQLIGDCNEDVTHLDPRFDPHCKFWSSVAMVAAHWMVADDDAQLSQFIERLPSMISSKNVLSRALMWSYIAKRDFIVAQDEEVFTPSYGALVGRCNQASKLLKESLLCCRGDGDIVSAFQLLACDWLLETRTKIWEQNNGDVTKMATKEELTSFEDDVNLLRAVAKQLPSARSKVWCVRAHFV
uniref:Uncharacterized protein n=1 Tax=Ciona savignyi TaxID=51511 RepID=H2ZI42_CIOSA